MLGTQFIDVWIGLKMDHSDGSYRYERSQMEELLTSSAWMSGEPTGLEECVFMWILQLGSILNTFDDRFCTREFYLALCELQ